MSRIDRIQENKSKTLAKLSGDTETGLVYLSPETSGSDESSNIRVSSGYSSNPESDVSSNVRGLVAKSSPLTKDFATGIFSEKSKEERSREFRNTASSSTVIGNSSTIDPRTALSGLNSSNPVIEESVETMLSKGNKSSNRNDTRSPGSDSVVKNPLEDFSSYNCIFTLGVLSPNSINDPQNNYRKNGATYTILRSGGGGINEKRVTTAFDRNGNLEYFIDDFLMSSIICPNQRTGISLGTRISFKVFEPYSLGIFLQNLEIAAIKAGYSNYLKAPFLLEIDFVGWDSQGNPKPTKYCNRKIPFELINIEFNVDKGGSVYEVECIPWNEQTLSDRVQEIKDPIEIRGSSVAEVLSFGELSLTAVVNQKQRELAERDELPLNDLYIIRFPKSRVKYGTSTSSPGESNRATVSKEDTSSNLVVSTKQYKSRVTNFFGASSSQTNNNIYQGLVSQSTTDVNSIGRSAMVENFNQGSNHPFPRGLYTYDADAQVYRRDGIELSLSDNERTFKFPQGMTIQKIIEEIVLISNFAENAYKPPDKDGLTTWFKVETECYLLESPEVEEVLGRKPKVYVFNVVPYKVHSGIDTSPNKGVKGIESLSKQVSKKYNYIYSGENKDVLKFDIQFRTSFFEEIRSDRTTESDGDRKGSSSSRVQEDDKSEKGMDSTPGDINPMYSNENVSETGMYTGGGSESDAKKNLAKQFHNKLLNSKTDLITANVEIWGDPYFLSDSGFGNYSASNSGIKTTITADGSMDYQRNEIDVLVNFKTPVDYQPLGGVSFQSDTTTIKGFSGLYKVITAESSISGNMFVQTLELVRRRNQTLDGIGGQPIVDKQIPSSNSSKERRSDRVGTSNSLAGSVSETSVSGITPVSQNDSRDQLRRN